MHICGFDFAWWWCCLLDDGRFLRLQNCWKTWWNSCHWKDQCVVRLENHIRIFSPRAVRFFSPELTEFLMLLMLKEKSSKKADFKSSVVSNNLIVCFKALRVWISHSNWVYSLAPYCNLNPRVWNLSSKKKHKKQSWQTWNLTPLDGGSRDVLLTVTWPWFSHLVIPWKRFFGGQTSWQYFTC